MEKIRVLFPEVEAGLGHIIPMRAIRELFEERYGKYVEVISCNFFSDKQNKKLQKYKEFLINSVKQYNIHRRIGHFYTLICEMFGSRLSSYGTLTLRVPGSKKEGIKYMEELKPDVVFSTHWATNYYAMHMKKRPFTVSYCPDAVTNALFRYPADITLISTKRGYEHAKRRARRYNSDNLRQIPFIIRNQVFDMSMDKKVNRGNLGLPLDNFTIILVEGGYGIGKTRSIVELLSKSDMKLTLIPICGKNEELYNYLCTINTSPTVTLKPIQFTERILEYIASSDLYCGKSGSGIAEPTFFGVPVVVTNTATMIERHIYEHYVNTIGSAMKEYDPEKVCELVRQFVESPDSLKPYIDNAFKHHSMFDAGVTCDMLFEEIKKRFNLQIEE